jgi:hypothetical protein
VSGVGEARQQHLAIRTRVTWGSRAASASGCAFAKHPTDLDLELSDVAKASRSLLLLLLLLLPPLDAVGGWSLLSLLRHLLLSLPLRPRRQSSPVRASSLALRCRGLLLRQQAALQHACGDVERALWRVP